MRTTYQVHIVFLEEARHHVGSECERDTTIVFAPARDVLIRIGPEQIAKQSAVRDLFKSAMLAFRRRSAGTIFDLPLVESNTTVHARESENQNRSHNLHQWDA